MNEYRYFIADDNKTGTLICSNEIKGKDMLLLVGHIIYLYNAASVDDIVDKLVTMYGFSVMKEHITALDLNTNPDTPYTYYDLIDEGGYCESDGYMYTDINRIKKLFSGEKSQKMWFRKINRVNAIIAKFLTILKLQPNRATLRNDLTQAVR
ncbi:MAG TPA: hypothetical protein DCZ53_10810 [Ruminococcus sp.]|jgi:hypothetical protein|nr:hypothetical protein [Ruminococcus sp.]